MTNILNNISKITLQHYQSRAESFWQGTKDHDVSQNIEALCQSLDKAFGQIRCKILDFGCGPGRDLLTFRQKGHEPVGLDGCPAFVEHARQYSGCNVWQQDFLHLELPKQTFHGIFANASFFQIPSRLMPDTLSLFHQALLPGGVLFMSNPRGQGEGFFGDRYATYLELEDYSA
ncbi:MAG: class I SAM-dependent methyltransferase, partial [Gammaproteobacteria bacterium]